MPEYKDFSLGALENGALIMSVEPPTGVGGLAIQFTQGRRFPFAVLSGAVVSGLITKSCASGYGGGASGITVTDSGQGRISVALGPLDVSGSLEPGCYAYQIERLDSGSRTVYLCGYRLVK